MSEPEGSGGILTRKTTTVMLEDAGCAAGSAQTVEKVLRDVPGVLRAYANPATEAAYVEYDAERCKEADLVRALESLGLRVVLSPGR
ncbi:MAG: heavy-metal-associated domain-containing protein [Gemmatimonadaceae bacterium]|nr:heavy-metal-associated domain-containing protein [Gemmatimonadaceae bacterium]